MKQQKMKKQKQDSIEVVELKAQREALISQVEGLGAERDKAVKLWHEEGMKSSKALGVAMEAEKMEKQLRVIGHIAAGRTAEAIQEILTPMPLVFKVDVRFADDATAMTAKKEMLGQLKQQMIEHMNGLGIELT